MALREIVRIIGSIEPMLKYGLISFKIYSLKSCTLGIDLNLLRLINSFMFLTGVLHLNSTLYSPAP